MTAEAPAAAEYQLKAAFVYNFAKFIEWPPSSFPTASSPFVIGVTGRTALTTALETAVTNRKINGRAIVIKAVETIEATRGTHLLFVAASEDKRLREFVPVLSPAQILTIGESEAFAKEGGIINFVLEGDKCRFDINVDAAERAQLKISAQLLKLARNVRRSR